VVGWGAGGAVGVGGAVDVDVHAVGGNFKGGWWGLGHGGDWKE
jgi:hypothetical protein